MSTLRLASRVTAVPGTAIALLGTGTVGSAFLARLSRAGELVDANVAPELVLDVLLVRWPAVRPQR